MTAVTLNAEQRLFVLRHDSGVGTLGFDVVFKRIQQYARKLGLALPDPHAIGTLQQYAQYREVEAAYIATKPSETLFDPDTPFEVQHILEQYRKSKKPLRLFYGDRLTGNDWMEENDVVGRIGRSTGPIHVALLLARNDNGGGAILTSSIVRILDATTRRELYRHANYQLPQLRMQMDASSENRYRAQVSDETGKTLARFVSYAKAQAWMEFLQGHRMKP